MSQIRLRSEPEFYNRGDIETRRDAIRMTKIRAAVCRAFGAPLVIEDVTLAPPGPNEIRVEVKACAICHSDISAAAGDWGGTLPVVLGHEAAGIVAETGERVEGIRPGDRVVVTLIRSCGHCPACNERAHVYCAAPPALDAATPISGKSGETVLQGLYTGAFAEQVVVHESQVCVIDDDIPLASASLLACGVLTGLGAVVNTAQMPAGADAVVIGAGGVGLNTIQGAAIAGARTAVAIDIASDKLEAARRFGATHALDGRDPELAEKVQALTGGRGASHVFVTVGAGPAFDQAMTLLRKGGACVLVGMPADGVTGTIPIADFAAAGYRIIGSKMGSGRPKTDIPLLIDYYRQGRLKLDELVTGRYPLDEINEAIASVRRGEALRNVIVFD